MPMTPPIRQNQFVISAALGLCLLLTPALGFGQDHGGVHMVRPDGEGERYWPRWRGPSGQGIVTGEGYPDTWSDTNNVLWKTSVPGRGHSSPIIWGDQIFLTTSRNRGRQVSVLSFSRSDGRLLWDVDAPAGQAEYVHNKNSPAAATATTDGERVYASFGSRGMLAVDL
ncbi:MAG: PQQ-binding-like beta-propeller repeat protein, partial [Acidobacteriota bacterium]|nr:PQQ-binding-like beta-propeller repeat protein [Acidobacteriota bacterium]